MWKQIREFIANLFTYRTCPACNEGKIKYIGKETVSGMVNLNVFQCNNCNTKYF